MALFKIFKGSGELPSTYKDGYCYFETNSGKMYIDTKDNDSTGRIVLNAEKADKLSSAKKITLSGNLFGSFDFDGSSAVTTPITVIGAKMTDHLWLTGANASSSTANSSQIIFGTEENNHVAISSNNNALVINPTASSTTNQIVLYLDSPSVFPSGIKANITGNASTASKLGTSTIGAAADRPIYLNAGTATVTTYRMAATNTTATTALSIANDLPTGIWYVNGTSGVSDFNQTDGVCIANQYSDKWITEIYQDYRTGQLAIRGKNNGTWQAWRKVLDSTNYTNYAPTKTGSGASGTWGISITGSAGSVAWGNITGKPSSFPPSSHVHSYITYTDTRADNQSPDDVQAGLTVHLKGSGTDGLSDGGSYHAILNVKDWGDYSGGPYWQSTVTTNNNMYFRRSITGTAWGSWQKILSDNNYTDYTVTKTGSGASGTWGVNITGNAATATKATQDGAGNVITSKYVTLDTAQTISGIKTMTGGLNVSGRSAGGGDDEGIVIGFANNGYAGLCLGGAASARSVFYFKSDGSKPFWRYNNGSASYDINHPSKSGTIALTSDLANYLQLSGGTMSGALNFANGTWNNVGDDCALGDYNQSGVIGIKGLNGATGIYFVPYSGSIAQKITIDGAGTMSITGKVSTETLQLIQNGVTSTISSQNNGWLHYNTNSSSGHWFNANVSVQGNIYAGTNYSDLVLTSANYTSYAATKNHTHNNYMTDAQSVPDACNFNTITKSGVYRYNNQSTYTNPPPNSWGQMLVLHGSGDTINQLAFDYSGANAWIRGGNSSDVGGTGSWYNWKRIWCEGNSITGAVWNDYAEYRESDCEEFGYVLMENSDDTLSKTTERLSHFAGVSSDTWGFSQGETAHARTPIAVAGRVLVYPYQDRNNYKPGDCVCAAPNGTVDIMTREEVINWPDRIVGTVSCVPQYEEWGGGQGADRPSVKVNNRIWIKVK